MHEKTSQKGLTNADKAERVVLKLTARAAALGHGTMIVKMVVHNSEVVEAEILSSREKIR